MKQGPIWPPRLHHHLRTRTPHTFCGLLGSSAAPLTVASCAPAAVVCRGKQAHATSSLSQLPLRRRYTRCANGTGRARSSACWVWRHHRQLTRPSPTTPSPTRPPRSSPYTATDRMDALHASTATSRTSSVTSSPSVAKRTGDVAVGLDSEEKTAQNHSVARLPMAKIGLHEEARRSVSAKTAGQASTATCARQTTPAML